MHVSQLGMGRGPLADRCDRRKEIGIAREVVPGNRQARRTLDPTPELRGCTLRTTVIIQPTKPHEMGPGLRASGLKEIWLSGRRGVH